MLPRVDATAERAVKHNAEKLKIGKQLPLLRIAKLKGNRQRKLIIAKGILSCC